jgi:hypothetical protein
VCKVIHLSLESSDPFHRVLSLVNPITDVPLQCSGGTGTYSTKKRDETCYVELCVFVSGGIYGSRSSSWVRNIDTLFFILRWDRYGYDKKRAETYYPELVFLHPVGSASHIVYSSASRARNVNAPFFMLGQARCSFHKEHARTRYAKLVFLHLIGSAGHVVHSGARNVDVVFFILRWDQYRYDKKVHRDTLHRTCVFASGGICGSRCTFWCIRGMKCRRSLFHARVGMVKIQQKSTLRHVMSRSEF